MEVKTKFVRAETKDLGKGLITAVVSTEDKDRDGDVIRASGWDLDSFKKHPVLLSSHNYFSLTNQIGEWVEMDVKGRRLVGTAEYYIGKGNDEADWGYVLAQQGRAAYSVGFIPDMDKAKAMDEEAWFPHFEFRGQELLEVSHVTIPSNRSALQSMKLFKVHPDLSTIVNEILEDEGTEHSSGKDFDDLMTRIKHDLAPLIRKSIADEINPLAVSIRELVDIITDQIPEPEPDDDDDDEDQDEDYSKFALSLHSGLRSVMEEAIRGN